MSKILISSSWGWRGAETILTVPDGQELVLRGTGEELARAVESLAESFYWLFGTNDEFDITRGLLRIYSKSRELCELLAAQQLLVDSSFRFVMVEEETDFIHLAEEPAVGPYVEIGDMRFGDSLSANHRPRRDFYEGIKRLRADPLARLVSLARPLIRLVGQVCTELSRLSSTQGWEAMQIQLLRIYGRSRTLVRALTDSRLKIDGFPFAYFVERRGVEISAHFQKALAFQEAKYIGIAKGVTIH